MKKKLVVLLAVVMMFAFSASAYAATFSDMDEQPVLVQDAVAKAVALGIIDGYEDGTFGPGQTITRAEFAKIAVTAAGAKETAVMLEKNASSFKDVKANSWYTGWINAGESLGIFLGDPNGNFRPNDTISNQEVVTVLMRLLGYNDNLTGTWPVNYVTKANQIEMLKDVTIVATAPATRSDVAVMLDAALDTYIVTYDKDTNEFVYKQTKIQDSEYITLLDDSFKGNYVVVGTKYDGGYPVQASFQAVTQVRNAADKTLNWNVGNQTYIIDEQTAVSHNGEDLFGLAGHQGRVYFVKDGSKYYARFIEVKSYTKTASDDVKYVKNEDKVTVLKTNYNAANLVYKNIGDAALTGDFTWTSTDATYDGTVTQKKGGAAAANTNIYNSNAVLFFDDDDQVYLVRSDKLFTDKAYVVKTVGSTTMRLVGTNNQTVNVKDGDTLIYDKATETFVNPSDVKAGDVLVEITRGDLYERVEAATGKLTRSTGVKSDHTQKYNVGGKNYLVSNFDLLDDKYENAGIDLDDVYGNDVKFVLNKDNTIAAVMVDETSTGTTLYGIVTDKTGSTSGWTKNTTGLTIFTEEGKTVSYDFDGDFKTGSMDYNDVLGKLVAYKLNKDNEIKDLDVVGQSLTNACGDIGTKGDNLTAGAQIDIKNNTYITQGSESKSLASNVVIFEVSQKDTDDYAVDPSLITRSSFLAKSNLTTTVQQVGTSSQHATINYFAFDTNTSGAIKVLAYTKANSEDLHYGIIATWNFAGSDYAHSVTFKGDDTVYELETTGNPATLVAPEFGTGGNGKLLVYKQSGDRITPVYAFGKTNGMKDTGKTRETAGNNGGLISFEKGTDASYKMTPLREYAANGTHTAGNATYDVMTDSNTLVFVVDATDGTYSEGSLSDISSGDWVYVPVVDSDGYADVVIVDEYANYTEYTRK